MGPARQSNKNHWIGVGRNACAQGIPIERILTQNSQVNAWIKEGYSKKSGKESV